MKQNLVVLLADLFNLFEIHPAKCVCYPGMEQQSPGESKHDVFHTRSHLFVQNSSSSQSQLSQPFGHSHHHRSIDWAERGEPFCSHVCVCNLRSFPLETLQVRRQTQSSKIICHDIIESPSIEATAKKNKKKTSTKSKSSVTISFRSSLYYPPSHQICSTTNQAFWRVHHRTVCNAKLNRFCHGDKLN